MKKVKLGDACVFIRNGANIKNDKGKSGIPITRIETIANGVIDEDSLGYANIYDEKYEDYYLKQNDILMSHINSMKHLGKVAICDEDKKIIHGMNLLIIRLKENILAKYVYYFFKTDSFRKQLHKISKQSVNQSSFNVNDLKKISIDLPDFITQNRVADIMDKVEEIIDIRKKQIEQLDELVKSQFVEMFGFPYIDNKYKYCKLEECVKNKEDMVDGPFGSQVNTKTDYVDDGEIPVIRTINVKQMSFSNENLKFMNREKYEKIIRSQVIPNDIIITKVGTIGNVCIFPTKYKEAVLSTTGSCRVRVDEKRYNTIYIAYNLLFSKEKMNEIASAGVQPFLNMKHIKNIEIIDSPIELQKKFADFVKQIDKQKFEIQKSLEEIQRLQESLMNKYFG